MWLNALGIIIRFASKFKQNGGSCSSSCGGGGSVLKALNGFINARMGADFIVGLVCVLLQGEVAGINVSNAAFAHDDPVEQALPERRHPRINARGAVLPDHRDLQVERPQ